MNCNPSKNLKEILRCQKCGKTFKKIDSYTYRPDCDCYKHKFYISVGAKSKLLKKDVKSAVEGLKKELKYKYKTDFISYDMIIQLVDKWFEDVI